jgi:hypothetical protein
MKQALLGVVPLAEAIGAPELLETVSVCLALLAAPGPLDKKALAPVLKITHEQIAELFRRGVEETTGELQQKLANGVKQAEEEAVWMQKVFEELDPDEPS